MSKTISNGKLVKIYKEVTGKMTNSKPMIKLMKSLGVHPYAQTVTADYTYTLWPASAEQVLRTHLAERMAKAAALKEEQTAAAPLVNGNQLPEGLDITVLETAKVDAMFAKVDAMHAMLAKIYADLAAISVDGA